MPQSSDPKYQPGEPPGPRDAPAGSVVSPDTQRDQRVPPGQSRTRKWPVLQYGEVPQIDPAQWSLDVRGLVEWPFRLTWEQFQQLPRVRVFADFHCVTGWSRLGNLWEGVAVRTLLEQAVVRPQARFVVATGYDDGWTTNLPLADFLAGDVLLADRHDGEPLSAEHGGPVRLVVPRLYAWKSAKWVRALTLLQDDQPGLWEQYGYHHRGDPWAEERFQPESGAAGPRR